MDLLGVIQTRLPGLYTHIYWILINFIALWILIVIVFRYKRITFLYYLVYILILGWTSSVYLLHLYMYFMLKTSVWFGLD